MNLQAKLNEFLLIAGLVAVSLFHCSTPRLGMDGPTTQTGNGMIAGMVYQSDGKTAAGNAIVYARKINRIIDISDILMKRYSDTSAIAQTDGDGNFSIDSIDTGIYIIECTDGDNDFVITDSVVVRSFDSTVILSPLSLKPAGSIKGVIRFSEGEDPRQTLVTAFGINKFANVETDGTFKFEKLAEGKYRIQVIPFIDRYNVFDTSGIAVKSADTTNLGFIDLCFTGLPKVKNISAAYDTLRQWVTLRWDRPASAMVKSFNIYRRAIDPMTAVLTQLNIFPIVDTIFIDSLGEANRTYEYFITAVDSTGTKEGVKSEGVSARTALYDITPRQTAIDYDTLKQIISLHWSNPDTKLVTGYNVYRRNVDLGEMFWTPFNKTPIIDTCFVDSTFNLCPNCDPVCDDSLGVKESTYEYCVGALLKNSREGVRSANMSIRISLKYVMPTNVRFSYDTVKQAVRLWWKRPDTTLVKSFNVLRRSCAENDKMLTQLNKAPFNDTVFIDSTGEQDQMYEYRIASVVEKNRAEVKSEMLKARIVASYVAVDSLWGIAGAGSGQLLDPSDIAVAQSGDLFIADQGNARIQVFDSTLHHSRQFGSGILHYPLKISVNDRGEAFVADYDAISDGYSIFVFDPSGAPIDTIRDSMAIYDLDVTDNSLYVLNEGRFISIRSPNGDTKRSWRMNGQDWGKCMVVGEQNKIFISANLGFPDKNKIIAFDSLGIKTLSTALSSAPDAIAYEAREKRLYIVCDNGAHGDILRVEDENSNETATYKIHGEMVNLSIAVEKNGVVLLVYKDEGKILKLKPIVK